MRRVWIGVIFLLALLVSSLTATWAMDRIHGPVEADLNRAAEQAMAGDWEEGTRLFTQARDRWDKWEHLRFSLADHTPVEEISAAFRALEVYCTDREDTEFAAHCRELARKTAAVGEAHSLTWWNIF